jgi:hypothetical protein
MWLVGNAKPTQAVAVMSRPFIVSKQGWPSRVNLNAPFSSNTSVLLNIDKPAGSSGAFRVVLISSYRSTNATQQSSIISTVSVVASNVDIQNNTVTRGIPTGGIPALGPAPVNTTVVWTHAVVDVEYTARGNGGTIQINCNLTLPGSGWICLYHGAQSGYAGASGSAIYNIDNGLTNNSNFYF